MTLLSSSYRVAEIKITRMKKVFLLFSGGASTARYLMEHDPNYGKTYEFVGALTNKKDAAAISFFQEKRISVIAFDKKEWMREHGFTRDSNWRELYFQEIEKKIHEICDPDFIVMSGFMLLVPKFFCEHFFLINVHPADLRVTHMVDGKEKRKYIGDDAVTLAINAGEKETYSTIHQATPPGENMEDVDGGPIIAISDPLPFVDGRPLKDHQEEMKLKCDGPAMQKAIAKIVSGEFKKQ